MEATAIEVLLVEDNPDDALLLREALETGDAPRFELTRVERLEEALSRLRDRAVDVVLLDLSLPDGHGPDTLQRALLEVPHVPIVVLTGHDDEALALSAVRQGAQDYLIKGQIRGDVLKRSLRYAIERHRLQSAIRGLALIDELTGLYNRRGFMTLAEQHIRLTRRTKKPFFLVFADLDGLKRINDTFGHPEGDRAIIRTAEILRDSFRGSDILARFGGDEFVILVIDGTDESPSIFSPRLEDRLSAHNARARSGYALSLSLGIARFDPDHEVPLEELMARADEALYEQKTRRAPS